MMDAKHTPGPWSFDGPPDNHIVWSGPDSRICFLAHSNNIDPERDTANARLIAAAPNLLAAAKVALETLAPRKDDDFVWAAMTQLIAAISEAQGDAP